MQCLNRRRQVFSAVELDLKDPVYVKHLPQRSRGLLKCRRSIVNIHYCETLNVRHLR